MTDVATLRVGRRLTDLRPAAEAAATPRVWLLREDAVPAGDALPALLAAAPATAVSVPADPSGRPVDAVLGVVADHPMERVLTAVGERRLPLRYAPVVSLLADRELLLQTAPPDPRLGPYAGLEWTARLFAAQPAVLVAASTVTVPAAGPRPAPAALLRLARSPGFGPADALRQLHLWRQAPTPQGEQVCAKGDHR